MVSSVNWQRNVCEKDRPTHHLGLYTLVRARYVKYFGNVSSLKMRNVTRRIPLSFKISLYCEQEQVIFTNMIFVCKACLRLHQFAQSPGDDLVTVLTQFRILQPNIDDVNRFLNYLT